VSSIQTVREYAAAATGAVVRLIARMLIAAPMVSGSVPGHAGDDAGVLVLGRASDDPAMHYDRLKPMLDYVVDRMGDLGIRQGRVLMARDGAAMASYLRQGRVDWVTETAGAALGLIERGDAMPLALSWRGGDQRYFSVFIARRDSGITSLDDLAGRTIAFQHPMSTSAYLVPAGVLLDHNLSMAALLSPLDRPADNQVGYAFTGAEANSVAWVHQRLVDVAAVSNQNYQDLVEPVPDYSSSLAIIGRSPDYPRALELVRGDLPAAIRSRLLEVLLSASGDPDAADALASFFRTDRFSSFTPEIAGQLETLAPMVNRVRQELQ